MCVFPARCSIPRLGVVFAQHDHICIDACLIPLQTLLHFCNFKEEEKNKIIYFFKLCQIFLAGKKTL